MWFRSNFTIPAVAAIGFCLIGGTSTTPAYADFGDQLAKFLADDGEHDDFFGQSVAISGNQASGTVVVGAWGDDDFGSVSGAAYLFSTSNGAQIARLVANDAAQGSAFGYSVAIGGEPGNRIAIVGAHGSDAIGANSGAVYIFDGVTGEQIHRLVADNGGSGEAFGLSVATDPNSIGTAIFGAPTGDFGSAYIFDVIKGEQLVKLTAADGASNDQFGLSVAIGGAPGDSIAIVGAWLDDDNGENSGSAYLFDATTGQLIAKLTALDGTEDDFFGYSVAIGGAPGNEIVIVGAPGDDDNGVDSGSAYLFDAKTGTPIAKLLAEDGETDDRFGWSVAMSGTPGNEIALIGAPEDNVNGEFSGSVFVFDPSTGSQIGKLVPNDAGATDLFGSSVAISGDAGQEVTVVGAWNDQDENGNDTGSAYLFDVGSALTCPWDLNGNGEVDVGDLVILVGSFGVCGEPCPADFDEDGLVGVMDLLALITNFGECPGTGCPWDINGDGIVDRLDVIAVNDNLGTCDDPENCPWDVNGDGVVDGTDVSEVANHFGACPG